MKLMRQVGWGRALAFLLLVWLMFLLVAVGLLKHEPDSQTSQRISQAFKELQMLHQQRLELNKLLRDYNAGEARAINEKDFLLNDRGEPILQYEKLRRKIKTGVDEMWYFVSAQVRAAHKQAVETSPQLASLLNKILDEGGEHKRLLIKDIESLAEADGHDSWRERETAELSDLVQRRLHHLQNPTDCSKARKLLCSLNKGCGYGCQLHHIVYCLIVAYGTERTMILKSKGWRYHRAGWEDIYLPVSNTCTDPSGASISHWPGTPSTQVVQLPIVDSIAPRPGFLPLSVPKDLAPRISRLHGNPFVWWVGQFFKYLLRPQPATKTMLDTAAEKLNFKKPIVGVHIRRTDKIGTEAAFHSVDEYMKKVEEYYEQLALSQDVPVKRIYLASDDPKVFADVRSKYPEYEVVGDSSVSKTAAVATRYSDSSLNGIIMDIHFLSLCDYLVCTFSSQVCRVAYEIMQSMYTDASDKFCSLDDIYYYGGQNTHRQVAVMPHKARSPDQMDLELGDTVGAFGNHWDGYSMGRNLRTNQVGLYPSFKVQDLVEAVDFPTYSEVPLKKSNTT